MDRDTAEPDADALPGPNARKWVEFHRSHAAPSEYSHDFVWDVTAEAIGPFCTDVDGNVLLDFTSHVASAPLGYNNPDLLERVEAFDLVDPLKMAGQDFYAAAPDGDFPGAAGLLDRLTDVTAHYGFDAGFLTNSGAEAVENAMKICYDHTGGTRACTFEGGFHGRTLGALSVNRSKAVHRRGFPELAGVTDLPFCRDQGCDRESCRCGFFLPADGSRLREKLAPRGSLPPEDVAFVVLEPVQGEGGYRPASEAFVAEVGAVCEEYDIPLVADEIQSGIGRTGEMWAIDHYPVEPDVIASAKALRVGATLASSEVFPDEEGRLSTTWGGGDLLALLQGAATLDVIRERDLLTNARERGRGLRERLADAVPDHVVDVRGKGLMIGVELDSQDRREAVIAACLRRGLLTLGCGHRTLRLIPPLDVTEREIEMGATILLDALEDWSVRDAASASTTGEDAL